MGKLRQAWKRILIVAATLEAVHYIYLSGVVVSGISFTLRREISANTALETLFQYSFLISFLSVIAAIPFIVRRGNYSQGKKLNDGLLLESFKADYKIRPDGMQIVNKRRVRARKPTTHLTFTYFLTGSATASVTLRSPGELRGPVQKKKDTVYQVVFPVVLEKGQIYELILEYDVSDPLRSMKPFLNMACTQYAGYGDFHLTASFEGTERPREVYKWVEETLTEATIQPIEDLFLDSEGRVEWHEECLQAGRNYALAWSW